MASALVMADNDLIRGASLSATNEDPDWPIENVQDDDPGLPFKTTIGTTGTVITITLAALFEPEALFLGNHNLEGATVTLANGAGFSHAVEIPDRTRSGLCVNAWLDMRELANRNDDNWTLTISGASLRVAIGRIILAASIEELWVERDSLKIRPEHLTSDPQSTFFGKRLKYDKAVRQRPASFAVRTEDDNATIEDAYEAAHGSTIPWVFIPDTDVNDPWFVEFESVEWSHFTADQIPTQVSVREVSAGPHLYDVEAT